MDHHALPVVQYLQAPDVQGQHLDRVYASCAQLDERVSLHQHGRSCAAAELEMCLARREAAVANAAVAAVAKVLAAKQAAAETAKAAVSKAGNRLKQLQAKSPAFP